MIPPTSVLDFKDGDQYRIHNEYDKHPEVYLYTLTTRRALVGDDRSQHEESKCQCTVYTKSGNEARKVQAEIRTYH